MKKLLLMSLLSICSVFVIGANKVEAAKFNLENTSVICEPASISAGEATDCYLVGKPDTESTGASVHGYVTYAYTTKFLQLNGAKANENIPNTGAHFMAQASSATDVLVATGSMPDGMNGLRCNYDSTNVEASSDFGCGIFYTTKTGPAAGAFTPQSIRKNINPDILPNKNTTYGVIGSYQVSVASNVTGNECGNICVKAWVIPDGGDYADFDSCALDGKKPDGTPCAGAEQPTIQTPTGYECLEVHYQGGTKPGDEPEPEPEDPNPPTGTFASYSLLVAGALIAIAAITLAKKNTKIYKV